MLWDTAGQEEFDAITKAYYRGAQACVLAFSTTDRMSFEAVKDWKMKVRKFLFFKLFLFSPETMHNIFRLRMNAARFLRLSFKTRLI